MGGVQMKKYICSICGYIYDESLGDPDGGIAPGTEWKDVPENFVCPLCGATKSDFTEMGSNVQAAIKKENVVKSDEDMTRELTFGELSALCSNLSKGCDKQYRSEEAALFNLLSEYYKGKVKKLDYGQLSDIAALIQDNLNADYIEANEVSKEAMDRGALRSLAWSEKVTKILGSLLGRYEKQGNSLLENTHVYVCEICGFVYVGDETPDICPVCKVPKIKFIEIKRGDV